MRCRSPRDAAFCFDPSSRRGGRLGAEMEPLQVKLHRAKETKNTVRYEEPASSQPLVVGTLYVQKWALHRLGDPETITVTITSH